MVKDQEAGAETGPEPGWETGWRSPGIGIELRNRPEKQQRDTGTGYRNRIQERDTRPDTGPSFWTGSWRDEAPGIETRAVSNPCRPLSAVTFTLSLLQRGQAEAGAGAGAGRVIT